MMKKRTLLLSLLLIGSLSAEAWAGKLPRKASELPEKAVWLNVTKGDKHFREFKKHITLVDFWDYTSINSIRDLTYIKKWQELYGPLGFRVIGVHSPDFDIAHKKDNVRQAAQRLGIPFPVLMDNDFKIWKQYQVFSWPTQFLIDHKGNVVYEHIGEGNYREVEEKLRSYLSKANRKAHLPALAASKENLNLFDTTFCGSMSEEIRIGTGKGYNLRNPTIFNNEGLRNGKVITYEDQGRREPQGFFAQGMWRNYEDHFEHAQATENLEDYLGILFEGNEVYGVLDSNRLDPIRVYLLLDSQPIGMEQMGRDALRDQDGKTYVMVDKPRLYYLLQNVAEGPHELKVYTQDDGASVYGFSFGNRCLTDFDRL